MFDKGITFYRVLRAAMYMYKALGTHFDFTPVVLNISQVLRVRRW